MTTATMGKLAILVVPGADGWLGGVNYVKTLIRTLRLSFGKELAICLVQFESNETAIYQDVHAIVDQVLVLSEHRPNVLQKLQDRVRKKLTARSENPAFERILMAAGVNYCYSAMLHRQRQDGLVKSAIWLPDFQFVHLPEGSDVGHGRSQLRQFQIYAAQAKRIVLSSQDALDDCLKFLPAARGFTHVYRFRACLDDAVFSADVSASLRFFGLPERYLLVANLLAPTKNHLNIIRALALLKSRGLRIPVVCTGSVFDYRNPGYANTIFSAIAEHQVHDLIQFTGPIPRHHQLQLMRGAIGILQPSRFEGWNTGVEEGRALGKRFALSDLRVHREQVQDAYWFDPDDIEALASCMEKLFNSGHGFDLQLENNARVQYLGEIKAAGQQFMTIFGS